MAKKNPEKVGTISGIDIIRKTKPRQDISFRIGWNKTEKGRPRKKIRPRDLVERHMRTKFESQYQELAEEQLRRDLSSSRAEFEERIMGGTCLEHYGYLTNQFADLSYEALADCMRSYFAMRRGIGPNNPILIDKLEYYIDTWEECLSIADPGSSETERRSHAIKACYIDLNTEAACRFAMIADGMLKVDEEK